MQMIQAGLFVGRTILVNGDPVVVSDRKTEENLMQALGYRKCTLRFRQWSTVKEYWQTRENT